jgi:hypothetical protein
MIPDECVCELTCGSITTAFPTTVLWVGHAINQGLRRKLDARIHTLHYELGLNGFNCGDRPATTTITLIPYQWSCRTIQRSGAGGVELGVNTCLKRCNHWRAAMALAIRLVTMKGISLLWCPIHEAIDPYSPSAPLREESRILLTEFH